MRATGRVNFLGVGAWRRSWRSAQNSRRRAWSIPFSKLRRNIRPAWRRLTIRRWSRSGCGPGHLLLTRKNEFHTRELAGKAAGLCVSPAIADGRDDSLLRGRFTEKAGRQIWDAAVRLLHGDGRGAIRSLRSCVSRDCAHDLLLREGEFESEHSAPAGEKRMRVRCRLERRTGTRYSGRSAGGEESRVLGSREDARGVDGGAEGRNSDL